MSHTSTVGLAISRFKTHTGREPDTLILSMDFHHALAAEMLFGSDIEHGRLFGVPFVVASNPTGDWIEARTAHEVSDNGETDIVCYRRLRLTPATTFAPAQRI